MRELTADQKHILGIVIRVILAEFPI